jgi:hypothetical protein
MTVATEAGVIEPPAPGQGPKLPEVIELPAAEATAAPDAAD